MSNLASFEPKGHTACCGTYYYRTYKINCQRNYY